MVIAHHVDMYKGHAGEIVFRALRWANYGEFIDQVVLANRLGQLSTPSTGRENGSSRNGRIAIGLLRMDLMIKVRRDAERMIPT